VAIREAADSRPLEAVLANAAGSSRGAELWWLGQAGFLVRAAGRSLLVDPYLSDFLARKYAGKRYPHIRMMPSPLAPDRAKGIDLVLCTHRHSDHMDPDTLPAIASQNPDCLFVVPRAVLWRVAEIGLPAQRLVGMADGERAEPVPGIAIEAIHSAHEERKQNDQSEDEFLGYVIRAGGVALYHSGDCVPHAGLAERLAGAGIDAALLPINGRNNERRANGVPGNFTFAEAVQLCEGVGIPSLICHHIGMFSFNPALEAHSLTVDLLHVRTLLKEMNTSVQVLFAGIGVCFGIVP
jgi:L-ascorbate metabolism protein UlaG (beta-lactamase superfamily)